MITGDKEQLDGIAKINMCADDDGLLTVAWLPAKSMYILRCEHDHYPEVVKRNPSITQQYKQGEVLAPQIETNVIKGMIKHADTRAVKGMGPFDVLLPARDLSTGELLNQGQVAMLVAYAEKYGLDALRGHIYMMYGKPYISIDGYLFHANRQDKPYSLSTRPLKPFEYDEYKLNKDAHVWLCEITILRTGQKFPGLGVVMPDELTEEAKGRPGQKRYPVVAAHPWQLAQKRAEWQALRRAFPIGEEAEPNDH